MANKLTGDFEAVLQLSVRQMNGLLANFHQQSVGGGLALGWPHHFSIRLGDPNPEDGAADFEDWVRNGGIANGALNWDALRKELSAGAPPGASKRIDHEFAQLGQKGRLREDVRAVRGTARVQLSVGSVHLLHGSTSEVVFHCALRAHYTPDFQTPDLPEPIHGEVEVTLQVFRRGAQLLLLPSADDAKIRFLAEEGTNLAAADVERIAVHVRRAVRENVIAPAVDLPVGLAGPTFIGLCNEAGEALALPVNLAGSDQSAGNIQSVTQPFVGPSGFALGIRKESLEATLRATLDQFAQFSADFSIPIPILPDPTYHFSVGGVEVQWNQDSFEFIIKGRAVSRYLLAPRHDDVVVRRRCALEMSRDRLLLSAPHGELMISGLPGAAIDAMKLAILAEFDRVLRSVLATLNQRLDAWLSRFTKALHALDSAAVARFRDGSSRDAKSSRYGAVSISGDGIVIRGDIQGAERAKPIVQLKDTNHGQTFTALRCSVPGGRIDRMIWSWTEASGSGPCMFSGVENSATIAQEFVFRKPPGVTGLCRMSLRIEGVQTLGDGSTAAFESAATFHLSDPGEIIDTPSWWEPVTVPLWMPNCGDEAMLSDSIAAHVDVQGASPRKSDLTHNTLIYFADWAVEKPLEVLIRGLEHMRNKVYSLVVIVVVPSGVCGCRRREIETKLDTIETRFPVHLWLTEDHEGGWTRTFAVAKLPAIGLIDARRKFVWKYDGNPGAGVLANALDKDLMPAPAPRFQALRLAVQPGEPAPDVSFEDLDGNRLALHHGRGRELLLCFWQSWSAPCLRELQHLQHLHAEGGLRIVAFHGGKDRDRVTEIRRQYGLTFLLVQDAEQRIARRYGVRCWPTTVTLNGDGVVQHVQFGCVPGERSHRPVDGTAAPTP